MDLTNHNISKDVLPSSSSSATAGGILHPEETLGIIGAGNMPRAIVFPLFDKGLIDPTKVIVSASTDSSLNLKQWKNYGCRVTDKNGVVISESNVVIWAVKPQYFEVATKSATKSLRETTVQRVNNALHISVMAGVSLIQFQEALRTIPIPGFRTVRVMPNLGLQVGAGVAVFTLDNTATDSNRQLIKSLFEPQGLCYEVQESQINSYCGLFGSGIGFMFPIIEALSDGAVKMGIPRTISLDIAAQVMKGAGMLILQEKVHPAVMKDKICSPGGTTIAGIAAMEKCGVRNAIISAVEAATIRGDELGKMSKK